MADCAALEMLCTARYRGFESALSAINFESKLYQASRIKTFALSENVASATSSSAVLVMLQN